MGAAEAVRCGMAGAQRPSGGRRIRRSKISSALVARHPPGSDSGLPALTVKSTPGLAKNQSLSALCPELQDEPPALLKFRAIDFAAGETLFQNRERRALRRGAAPL